MPSMQLKNIVIDSIFFERNGDFVAAKDEGTKFEYEIGVKANFDEESRILSVTVNTKTPSKNDSPNYPFYFNVAVLGSFQFSEDTQEKIIQQYQDVNCPAIIFPYLREAIADITRRAGFPPLHLPPVNFIELAKKRDMSEKNSD